MERVIVSVRLENDPREWDLDLPAEMQAGQLAALIAGALSPSGIVLSAPRIEVEHLGRRLRDDESLASAGAWDGSSLILFRSKGADDDAVISDEALSGQQSTGAPFPAGYMLTMVLAGGVSARSQTAQQPAKHVSSSQTQWPIVSNPWRIGRGDAVHTDLSHIPNRRKIHHNHCYLEFDPAHEAWFLTRVGPRHGTYIARSNGGVYRLRVNEKARLRVGDEIHLADGLARLLFTRMTED